MAAAVSTAEAVASTVAEVSTVVDFTAAASAPRRVFHGGGYGGYRAFHYGGYRHAYFRPHFVHRHHFRRFYGVGDYPAYYGYPYRYCRVSGPITVRAGSAIVRGIATTTGITIATMAPLPLLVRSLRKNQAPFGRLIFFTEFRVPSCRNPSP